MVVGLMEDCLAANRCKREQNSVWFFEASAIEHDNNQDRSRKFGKSFVKL
jgi:hypothetical protein